MGQGIKAGGGSENLKPELQAQDILIDDILETIVGKSSGATATAETILEGYTAYVGKELVTGKAKGVTINGVKHNEGITLTPIYSNQTVSTLPYQFYEGCAVFYRGQLHILGSYHTSTAKNHYKYNGTSWEVASTLPYELTRGRAVVFNDEIHIMGGTSDVTGLYHYKWDGSTWKKVSDLPYKFDRGSVVVYNNQIHILGGTGNQNGHYMWNESVWQNIDQIPYGHYNGDAVVFNGEIHVLGGQSGAIQHHKWNNANGWVVMPSLPYMFSKGCAEVSEGKIHLMGSSGYDYVSAHYVWDGSNWSKISNLSKQCTSAASVVVEDEIHIFGDETMTTIHHSPNYTTYRKGW